MSEPTLPLIAGMQESSMLDWEGHLVATLFLAGCNFRCGYCHNPELVVNPGELEQRTFQEIESRLRALNGWLDGVCITGGEPTLQPALPALCQRLQALDLQVKLDTNGTRPEVLEALLKENLLSAVAMDVKAPLEQAEYDRITGVVVDVEAICTSKQLLESSGVEYELRTTAGEAFLPLDAVERMARQLEGTPRWVLQRFLPDNALAEEYRNFAPASDEYLEEAQRIASKYVAQCVVRG